jgi:NADH-quinone oxidoreductase subunit N
MFIAPVVPEVLLAVGSMICLMIGSFSKDKSRYTISVISLAACALCIYLFSTSYSKDLTYAFSNAFVSDYFIVLSKVIVLAGSLAVFMFYMVQQCAKNEVTRFELPVLMMLSVVGMMVLLSANNFISAYMGLELQSLCFYVLASFNRDNSKSAEAGLKYFVLGAVASGILLYGVSLIYGFTGTINFVELEQLYRTASSGGSLSLAVLAGIVMVMVGIFFKLASVPFHMWAPDVYQGSPTLVTALFAIVPKAAIILFLARLLLKTFGMWVIHWQQIVIFASAASMIVGALGALGQSNIKRLLSYSSIGHVGYLLMGIAAANSEGMAALITYIVIYIAISVGMFAILILLNTEDLTIRDLSGMGAKYPCISFMFAMLILSLAGIPPLAGFLAKFYIFSAAIKSNLYVLAIIGILASLISAYYYLNIIKAMYFINDEMKISLISSKMLYILIAVMVLSNLLYVVEPGFLHHITISASKIFFL